MAMGLDHRTMAIAYFILLSKKQNVKHSRSMFEKTYYYMHIYIYDIYVIGIPRFGGLFFLFQIPPLSWSVPLEALGPSRALRQGEIGASAIWRDVRFRGFFGGFSMVFQYKIKTKTIFGWVFQVK